MMKDIEKIGKAREIILNLANEIDPITGNEILQNDILRDPRIIRSFFIAGEVLDGVVKGEYSKRPKNLNFKITSEQKANISFTEGEIGVNEVARCINEQINPLISKKTTGILINRGLKRMGILSELESDYGKKRTTVNENSENYGFIEVKRNFNGREYMQVLANDIGKRFVLDNIERIMKSEESNN